MPQEITNQDILSIIDANVKRLDDINQRQEDFTKSIEPLIDELNDQNKVFKFLMDEEYGWGNWQGVDAKNHTFIPREEFSKDWYVVSNPNVKIDVSPDDVEVTTE